MNQTSRRWLLKPVRDVDQSAWLWRQAHHYADLAEASLDPAVRTRLTVKASGLMVAYGIEEETRQLVWALLTVGIVASFCWPGHLVQPLGVVVGIAMAAGQALTMWNWWSPLRHWTILVATAGLTVAGNFFLVAPGSAS